MPTRAPQLTLILSLLIGCSSLPDTPIERFDDGGNAGTGAGSGGASNAGKAGATGKGGSTSSGGRGGTSAGTSSKSGSGGQGEAGSSSGVGGTGALAGDGGSGASPAGSSGGGSPPSAGQSGGGSGGAGGSGSSGMPNAPIGCEDPGLDAADFRTVYEVGPGEDYATPSDVPWEALEPSTLVRIHARSEPYRDKWVLNAAGTEAEPIVVLGVPEAGVLPIITGEDAVTRSELDYWNEPRGVVKIGGANVGDGAAYLTVACLDIRSARAGVSFTEAGGGTAEYADNAACVYLEEGRNITVQQNLIHDCGNGIFSSSGVSDLVISGNHVFDNGNAGSVYEHNSYTEATNITFEFNHFGPLCADCGGNNIKDRSAGTVVRYNWIEGGNRQLDLVESDYDELIDNPAYRETFVYGNVLVEPDGAGNSQIVHYGGDGGDETKYRKGTLYFVYNTIVSTRAGNTTLFRLSSDDETADVRNNLIWASSGGSRLAILDETGSASLMGNWLSTGWVETHGSLTGSVDDGGNLDGADPGFANVANQDFSLCGCSPCKGTAVALPAELAICAPEFEYVKDQSGAPRASGVDVGAYQSR